MIRIRGMTIATTLAEGSASDTPGLLVVGSFVDGRDTIIQDSKIQSIYQKARIQIELLYFFFGLVRNSLLCET